MAEPLVASVAEAINIARVVKERSALAVRAGSRLMRVRRC
jgi:hypothetical protein